MSEQFSMIPIDSLVYSGRNPRTKMRGIEELAESIKEYGMLQPIIVRPLEDKFEVVVGERRVMAGIKAGLREVPAIIRDLTTSQTDELRLIENIQREDLTNAEKGDGVLTLIVDFPEKYPTIKSVAEMLKVPYKTVQRWIQKSRRLSSNVKMLIQTGKLGEDQAYRIMKYSHSTQDRLAEKINAADLTERQTIKFVKLFDENPTGNLDEFIRQAKGIEKVVVPLEDISGEARKEIKEVLKKKKEAYKKARKKSLEKAVKESVKARKKRARGRFESPSKKRVEEAKAKLEELLSDILKSSEIPEDVKKAVLEQLELVGYAKQLAKIKDPMQRERMIHAVTKELKAKMKERLEKAPKRRLLVEHKLARLRELEREGVPLSTLWDIGERKDYAGSKDFHGNCPPQIVEYCVLRLTHKGDLVVDPMAGSGTALDVCWVLDRRCIGYDIKPPTWREDIIQNDSRKIPLESNSADMVFLHPPYWDMVYYTKTEEELPDLSRVPTLDEYQYMLKQVLLECHRILKEGKYLSILLGDRIKGGRFIPLCRKAVNLAEQVGFIDCGYAVKFTRGATSKLVKGKMIYAELAYTENLKPDHDLVMFFRKAKNNV